MAAARGRRERERVEPEKRRWDRRAALAST
jgi:hypothetical protein